MAGELRPAVFHIAARSVSKHALSIYNDHSDVMSVRMTGCPMLVSNSVQEVMDMALVAHIASLKASLPFIHFFDGNRTSSEIQKIHQIPYEDMAKI
jgi:pyruvate/2-oxoacid:ferredoxin oxidoreductase alpha subunit